MNKIGWCTDTINPITGCLNDCPYCYARKMAYRLKGRFGYPEDEPFRPAFHPDKLQDIYNLHGAGKRIFLDSMGDWFSEGIDPAWIEATLNAVKARPNHTFLVLTKRPDRIPHQYFPSNVWLGVSVTDINDVWRIDKLYNKTCVSQKKFISFEPLHGQISYDLAGISWVIIGRENGNRVGRVGMKKQWVDDLCCQADALNIPVFLKGGLCGPNAIGQYGAREEFPRSMI